VRILVVITHAQFGVARIMTTNMGYAVLSGIMHFPRPGTALVSVLSFPAFEHAPLSSTLYIDKLITDSRK
jgi:hypothetical protein